MKSKNILLLLHIFVLCVNRNELQILIVPLQVQVSKWRLSTEGWCLSNIFTDCFLSSIILFLTLDNRECQHGSTFQFLIQKDLLGQVDNSGLCTHNDGNEEIDHNHNVE
mgnify:CR=1 FL=1